MIKIEKIIGAIGIAAEATRLASTATHAVQSILAQQNGPTGVVLGFDRNGVGAVAALPVANHLVVTQGATPGPAASSADVLGISDLLVDAPDELLPKEVAQHLKKVARSFDKSFDRYVRNKRPVRKVEEDLVIMRDGSSRRYPPGVRPFPSQGDLETLDEPLMGSTGNACVITITIPKNSTIKDSMEIVHHRAAFFMKECNLEALLLLQTSLAPIITKKVFIVFAMLTTKMKLKDWVLMNRVVLRTLSRKHLLVLRICIPRLLIKHVRKSKSD